MRARSLALAAFFALTASAHAGMPAVEVETLTPSLTVPKGGVLTVEVSLRSTQLERLNVSYSVDRFSDGGFAVGPVRDWQLDGGIREIGRRTHATLAACTYHQIDGVDYGGHGYEPNVYSEDITLLPNQPATLTISWLAGHIPLWPGMRITPTIELTNDRIRGEGTLEAPLDIPVPAPAVNGQTGVRIAIETEPTTAFMPGLRDVAELAKGTPVRVRLSTDPPLPGETLDLFVQDPLYQVPPRRLTSLVLDDQGRARTQWWPAREGIHPLWAGYSSTRPDLADDFSCARTFSVTPGTDVMPPDGALAADLVAWRVERRGSRAVALAELRCPPREIIGWCRGRLRAQRGGRPGPSRSYRLASSATMTLGLRLPRGWSASTATLSLEHREPS